MCYKGTAQYALLNRVLRLEYGTLAFKQKFLYIYAHSCLKPL